MKKKKDSSKKAVGFPQIKKEIKDFLLSEEGKVTEKKIAKMGIAIGVMAMMLSPDDANAAPVGGATGAHSSVLSPANSTNRGGHGSHAAHGSHGSHGSHGDGGWC